MSCSNLSISLLIKGDFAPKPVCCGPCGVHCGYTKLNSLQGGEKWDPPQRQQIFRMLKLSFPPTIFFSCRWCKSFDLKTGKKSNPKQPTSIRGCNKIFITYSIKVKPLHICEIKKYQGQQFVPHALVNKWELRTPHKNKTCTQLIYISRVTVHWAIQLSFGMGWQWINQQQTYSCKQCTAA